MGVLNDARLERFLQTLHETSDDQIKAMSTGGAWRTDPGWSEEETAAYTKRLVGDKLFALDRDKAECCYQLCRAMDARRIVEIGTSFGVSTIYLAAAVRDNIAASGGEGMVIGTEYEPAKAMAARQNFETAGLSQLIELREGDLRETLARDLDAPVDVLFIDIWPELARPAVELVSPHLRTGSVVLCDKTEDYRASYADYFAFINAPEHAFRTITLPYRGGFELSVRVA